MQMKKGKIFLFLEAAVCLLLTGWLALAAVAVFREGSARKAENPLADIYTPDAVAEKFAPVVPLFLISLGLLAAGLLLGIRDEKADQPVRDTEISRDLVSACVAYPSDAMKKERLIQKRLSFTGWGLFVLCMVPAAVYLASPEHFPRDDPESMFSALLRVLLPWTAAGLGALAVTGLLRDRSLRRETEAARAQLRAEKTIQSKRTENVPLVPNKRTGSGKVLTQTVLMALAAAFIVAGVLNGSALDVLIKAITICSECIGLG